MKESFKRYLQNLPGKRIDKKVIVIESDDWGSIRMPSIETYKALQKMGAQPENDPYLKYDSLASESDLQALFEVLSMVIDSKGNPAKITANAVVANPDFEKISSDNFQNYHFEPFTQTLQNYPEHSNSLSLWKEGMQNKLFWPQYHGREHLNVYQWMKALKNNDEWLKTAFNHKMISVSSKPSLMRFGYMEGLDYLSFEEKMTKAATIEQGMQLFIEHFGYTSRSFIANCYIWDKEVEKTLSDLGVNYLQGILNQILPSVDTDGKHKHIYKRHYFGQKNEFGQSYLIRNVFFEPSLDPKKDWISHCLKRIDIAFKCKKPAIICSHRLNFIGYIDEKNRTNNLRLLKNLLNQIILKWPDVEFMSSDEIGNLIISKKNE